MAPHATDMRTFVPLATDHNATATTTAVMAMPVIQPSSRRAALVVITGQHMGEVHVLDQYAMRLGRDPECDIVIDDDGISREHCVFTRLHNHVTIEDLGSTNGTWIDRVRVDRRRLRPGDRIRLGLRTIIRFMLQDEADEAYHRELYEAAVRDGLTGLYNKRFFNDRLDSEMAYAKRHKQPLSLLLFDVDHFKRVNDTAGHPAGDALLTHIGRLVTKLSRSEDVVARFGGDEFAVIGRGLDAPSISVFAERIRTAVAETPLVFEEETLPITLSVGVASLSGNELVMDKDALLDAADKALYAAKRAGRDQVCAYAGPANA
ncbi:MAG: two-component system cell cycle response regulator [Myxococcota bacterium]|jgi:two-component system cell cycle response regulator